MIDPGRVAAVLLAAGRSTRFGAMDKLAVPVDGLALGLHAARMLGGIPFAARIAVTRGLSIDGFVTVRVDDPAAGQAESIRHGVAEAARHDVDAVLIALADMPLVPASHFAALLAAFDGTDAIVASLGDRAMPPALFGRGRFAALQALEGDRGAVAMLADAIRVVAPARALLDIDTPADLAAAFTSAADPHSR